MITILLLIPILFLCFFLLFIFSKHDFVLLRQNISLSEIFDRAVIGLLFALVIGRLIFIVNDLNFSLLHVFRFFHLIKFPGISMLGFFVGGILIVYLLFRKKKGLGRIYDIFSLSFFPLFLFFLVTQGRALPIVLITSAIAVLLFLYYIFVTSHHKYILRDGGISLILLLIICISVFALQALTSSTRAIVLGLSFAQILSVPIALATLVFIFTNQGKHGK